MSKPVAAAVVVSSSVVVVSSSPPVASFAAEPSSLLAAAAGCLTLLEWLAWKQLQTQRLAWKVWGLVWPQCCWWPVTAVGWMSLDLAHTVLAHTAPEAEVLLPDPGDCRRVTPWGTWVGRLPFSLVACWQLG